MIVWVITAAAVVFMALVGLWKARPAMDKFVRITNALDNLPHFMQRTDQDVAKIRAAVFPNHGSAIPDGIERLERDVSTILNRLDGLESWVQTESDDADRVHSELLVRLNRLGQVEVQVRPEDSAGA